MGLNPGMYSEKAMKARQDILNDCFNGGSPYFDMFRCGYYGVALDDCIDKCRRNGIAIRKKDIESYNDGAFKNNVSCAISVNGAVSHVQTIEQGVPFEQMKLDDFPRLPQGWVGTDKRFFPCTQDNKPMQKWGYTREYTPELYKQADARALSPCGWVGQNMLYQKFVVMDIDGRGHGADDDQVIAFGNLFKDRTFSMEDPRKPGSFHLYFTTDRLIPVKHFPWAKLDFMGNAVNAAVYLKNKLPNNLPLMELDEEIWQIMMTYQKERKERICL